MNQTRMKSVFTSLLTDALEFVHQGGQIRLTITTRQETNNQISAIIKVEDKGYGIGELDLSEISDRYYRAHHALRIDKKGNDTELSFIRDMIEAQGGNMFIQSKKDIGTCITFYLSANNAISVISSPKDEAVISADEKFLNNITRLIDESLSDPDLNVAFLCKKSGTGNKKVYRKVKELTGMSVVEYIRSIRLKKAAMLLRQQKISITEILYLVGFSNHSYFAKCFKNEYGMSPKEFVARHINFPITLNR